MAGVGVMNIMLVSVTERTREIGIEEGSGEPKTGDPPAVCHRGGCDQHHRRSGGNPAWLPWPAWGSVCSWELTLPPTVSAVLVSFSVSVGIGLVFGYMPASRAAGLNPIDALRSE